MTGVGQRGVGNWTNPLRLLRLWRQKPQLCILAGDKTGDDLEGSGRYERCVYVSSPCKVLDLDAEIDRV